jgi:hypothetical protein
MCHEQWWAERRRRRAEESREVWLDFDRTRPVDEPAPVPGDEPDTVRLEQDEEPVAGRR